MTTPARPPSAIDAIAETWVDTVVSLNPVLGTYIGRDEGNERYPDLGPDGHERYAQEARRTLDALGEAAPVDDTDRVTQADLSSELRLDLEFHTAQWHLRDLNVIACPVQEVRQVYDLMPTGTVEDWAVIAARLRAVPEALRGYTATLREGISCGVVPARRQVCEVATQIARYTADDGFFASFVADAAPDQGQLPASLARELADNASAARVAYDEVATFLTSSLAEASASRDGVGRDLYALHSRRFLGAKIDLDETYEWGREELARMVAEQTSIAHEIRPGASVTEFDTWRERTTVYHEGVPGHHLQIGQAVYNTDRLNSWRRLLAGTAGHAEGWALYAERLMEQLGYLEDPADRLGMLDGQRMRAARVVLDIGVHLGKSRPDGGGVWDADYALDFLRDNVNMPEEFVRFEVNRYLGWPGQALSYKVGQRIWEEVRDAYRAARPDSFDIKEFHSRALDLGGVGLDTLRSALVTA